MHPGCNADKRPADGARTARTMSHVECGLSMCTEAERDQHRTTLEGAIRGEPGVRPLSHIDDGPALPCRLG
ncbi:hypothetical protein AB205_0059980 [Aquarana catesbeiana]|uniref:Uncharacterized protein n=1 Tax=Aquarana catesbeiana TaxID=8400 RepID=A0A2G9PUC2_AQUCT|nr:hypothetical protein AB205_0059980 [Aquarana catesbeiana]PIO06891.1 hypothetical protein AB205_0059980 [Aquarana catesbeiana]